MVVKPVWISRGAVQSLPEVAGEHFEIKSAQNDKHQLVVYWRDGEQNLDTPHTYRWNGREFVQ